MKVVIRAFNKDGYHKDIMIASERQVHMQDARCTEALGSLHSGLFGTGGVRIDPKNFPEMVHFEIVIQER